MSNEYTEGQQINVSGISATVQWQIGNLVGVIWNDDNAIGVVTVNQIDKAVQS